MALLNIWNSSGTTVHPSSVFSEAAMTRPNRQGKDSPGEAAVKTCSKFPYCIADTWLKVWKVYYCSQKSEILLNLLLSSFSIFLLFREIAFCFPFWAFLSPNLGYALAVSTTARFSCCGKELKHLGEGLRLCPSLFPLYITQDTRTRFVNCEVLKYDEILAWCRKKPGTSGNGSNVCPQLPPVSRRSGHRTWAGIWLATVMLSSAVIYQSWGTALPFATEGASSIMLHSLGSLTDEYSTQCQQRMVQTLKFMSHERVARPSCQISNRYSIALCFA